MEDTEKYNYNLAENESTEITRLIKTRIPQFWFFDKGKAYFSLIKFSHSIFALPFALSTVLYVADSIWTQRNGLIILAMILARSASMAFNRIFDVEHDVKNPRTQNRELVTKKVSVGGAYVLTWVCGMGFIVVASTFNLYTMVLSPFVLALLVFYTFTKRFTPFAPFYLGFCLGLTPLAVELALKAQVSWFSCVLALAILFWVASFDIIYSLLDYTFDKANGLNSMGTKYGVHRALNIAKYSQIMAGLLFLGSAVLIGKILFFATLLLCLVFYFMMYRQNKIECTDDVSLVINPQLFTQNGCLASIYFLGMVLEVYF